MFFIPNLPINDHNVVHIWKMKPLIDLVMHFVGFVTSCVKWDVLLPHGCFISFQFYLIFCFSFHFSYFLRWIWLTGMLNFKFCMLKRCARVLFKDALQEANSFLNKSLSHGPTIPIRAGGSTALSNYHLALPNSYHNGLFLVGGG